MTTPAVFRCTYSDWKVVKGRKVVQVVLEMPLETADTAYQVLGGMPSPAAEVWCAVARLNEVPAPSCRSASSSGEREPESDPGLPAERGHKSPAQSTERRKFDELSPPQQAGILCSSEAFYRFLGEKFGGSWAQAYTATRNRFDLDFTDGMVAAECVRRLCGVASRRDIHPDNTEWLSLLLAYRLWQNHPELEDA